VTNEQKLIARIIAKCWADPGYKARFMAAPADVLREAGVSVPQGANLYVHEAREGERHFVLPPLPSGSQPNDVGLEHIVPLLTYYGMSKIPKPFPGKGVKKAAKKSVKRGAKKGARKSVKKGVKRRKR
jgi:hypothetical protein